MNKPIPWDQSKVDAVYDACRAIYDTYGINMDPRMVLAIIQAEGTGSFNTDNVNKAADGGGGPTADFAKDTLP